MKALTLYQPWATLVAIGAKKIETRSWKTNYRGPLAIHAGKNKKFIDGHLESYICNSEPFYSILMNAGQIWPFGPLPRGAIIAICDLVECKQIDLMDWKPPHTELERSFGDYATGRYMWFLKNIEMLPVPVEINGSMGLWEWMPL